MHRSLIGALCTTISVAAASSAQVVPVILRPMSQSPDAGGPGEAAGSRSADAAPPGPGHFGCGKAEWARTHRNMGLDEDPAALAQLREAYNDTDLLNCNLDIELFTTTNPNIGGSNTMTVKSLVDGLTEFSFMLRSQYTCVAKLNGSDAAAPLASFGTYGRRVTLDRPYNKGEIFTVRVEYSGQSLSGGFGSISISNGSGYSLSEPYFSATWWPVKDGDQAQAGDNADKFTVQVAVTAPSKYKTVSNGLLQGIDPLPNSRSRTRWASNYPIAPYLVSFCTRSFPLTERTWNYTPPGGDPISMPVQLYYSSVAGFSRLLDMLTTLSNLYGTYPFAKEKYAVYAFGFSGGMEHQTCTGQGVDYEWVNVHELGHQWWGDNVTCRYWNDIWLNEGFATYTEALWAEFQGGSDDLGALAAQMANNKISGTVYKYQVTNINTLFDSGAYQRGSWVLHMLRHQVGDDVFFHGILPAYRAAYQGSAATTNDFAAVCSSVTGKPMQPFFDQWVFGSNNPAYTYGFTPFSAGGKNYIRLVVNQTQSTSYGANGKFVAPIDFRLGSLASDPIVTVQNTARQQWYVIPVANAPASLTLDPGTWLLWNTRTSVAYTNGPAKILASSPAPGARITSLASDGTIRVAFSEDVHVAADDFVVTGPGGVMAFTMTYDPQTWTATLDTGASLPAGSYAITVRDSVTTSAAAIHLDGEIADPDSPASLPSGDGLPLGAAVLHFSVRCTADLTDDGVVDLLDFFAFFNAWDAQGPAADVDQNGLLDLDDFFGFFNAFDAAC